MQIPKTPIRYDLDLSKVRTREVQVAMTVDLPSEQPLDVVMPHLSPGSPTNSLNHDARIRNVRVTTPDGEAVPFEKLREGGFRIEDARHPIVVHYTVSADTFSHVRANLTEDHAYLNGPAVAMFVRGHEDKPSIVELDNIPDPSWQSDASLPKLESVPHAFYAPTFRDLADTNIYAGKLNTASAVVEGTELTVNVHGTPPWEGIKVNGATPQESLDDLKALYRTFIKEFGTFPMSRYIDGAPLPAGVDQQDKYFLNKHYLHNGKPGAGGYEHYHGHELLLSGTAKAGIAKNYDGDGRAYERGIMAHELIHKLLSKFVVHDGIDAEDLSHVHKTDGLWLTEGTTDWAGKRLELLAGLATPQEHVAHYERILQRYLTDYAHNATSPTDDSLDAHVGNSNFYNKGAVAAAVLDLELRALTGGKRDFFDVLQALKEEFGGTGEGFTLDDVQRLTEQVAGPAPGARERVAALFDDHFRDRKPFDLNASLSHVGYALVEKLDGFPEGAIALGGTGLSTGPRGELQVSSEASNAAPQRTSLPGLGVTLVPKEGQAIEIGPVAQGSAAQRAGLGAFTGSVAQGVEVQSENGKVTAVVFTFESKDDFTGESETHTVSVAPEQPTRTVLEEIANPSAEQLARRAEWLNA